MGREKFSALDMLSKRSLPERKEKQAIIYKDPRELVPTQENFYTTKNISKLKASIKITGYLMQPILIENVDGEDKVLAGHRRRLCCIELIEEGDTRFEKVPCMYAAEINVSEDKELTPEQREAITPFLRQFKVIQANNYRDKNDWERMQEALEMEKIVKGLKEKVGITGTVRENLKELLGVSNAQFGRYKNISNHLSEELMEEFQDGEINISVADAAASLEPELQKLAYEMYMKNKILTLPDIQLLKDRQALNADIPGQMTIEQATRQQKPAEDETPIPVELQIERFFDSLKKNTTARIRNGDKLMGTKMIRMKVSDISKTDSVISVKIRKGSSAGEIVKEIRISPSMLDVNNKYKILGTIVDFGEVKKGTKMHIEASILKTTIMETVTIDYMLVNPAYTSVSAV